MTVDCYSMFTLLSTCASELHIPTKFHPNQSSNHIPPRCSNGAVSISQYGDCGVANLIPVAWLVTALVWYITIHGWVITTSGFRRQTTTILDRFIIWPHSSLWHAVVFNTTKFRRNVTPGGQFKLRAKFGPCSIGILNLKFLALTVSELWRGPRIIKVGHVISLQPRWPNFAFLLEPLAINHYAKFEVYCFNRSRDMGSQNSKSRSRDPFTTAFWSNFAFSARTRRGQSACQIWSFYLQLFPRYG